MTIPCKQKQHLDDVTKLLKMSLNLQGEKKKKGNSINNND